MRTSPKDSLYIKALLWAYEKRDVGFMKQEMKKELNISDEEWPWVSWMLFNGLNGDSPLAYPISNEFTGKHYTDHNQFFLTASGTSAVIDYLELKEAQEGGKRATRIAIASIIISILVGLAQIYFDVFYHPSLEKIESQTQEPITIGKG